MADIFLRNDARNLLRDKHLLMFGCSNMRALYRDIIWLINNNTLIPPGDLRRKLDFSYLGDRLLKQGELNRGRDFKEIRQYKKDGFHIRFIFLTKIYTEDVEDIMINIKNRKYDPPDVLLINSCIWDITRWGPDGVNLYKKNMHKVMNLFQVCLPPSTLVVYNTSLPLSPSCRGAFLVKQVEFMKHSLRFEIMEANLFAKQVVPTYGYNILDFHFHLRMQIHCRTSDGVHWKPIAVRQMSNLFLTHIALSLELPLPGNFKGKLLSQMKSKFQITVNNRENTTSSKLQSMIMPPPRICRPLRTDSRRNIQNNLELSAKSDLYYDKCVLSRSEARRKKSRNNYHRTARSSNCDTFFDSYADNENFEPFNKPSHSYKITDMPSYEDKYVSSHSYESSDIYNPGKDWSSSRSCNNLPKYKNAKRKYKNKRLYSSYEDVDDENIDHFYEPSMDEYFSESRESQILREVTFSCDYEERHVHYPMKKNKSSHWRSRDLPY